MDASEKIRKIQAQIAKVALKKMTFLECYSSHTVSLAKYGIRKLLPTHLEIVSGPGCPIATVAPEDIDYLNELARDESFQIASFGDLVRISDSSGRKIQARPNVKVIYSPQSALEMALKFPEKKIVFTGIGFENAIVQTAQALITAKEKGVKNFFVLNLHKRIISAIDLLLSDTKRKFDGLILPSDIALTKGPEYFLKFKEKMAAVITGFDPVTFMEGLFMLIKSVSMDAKELKIAYKNTSSNEAYSKNDKIEQEVFSLDSANWRGMGLLEKSGVDFNSNYSEFDIKRRHPLQLDAPIVDKTCLCQSILWKGKNPLECKNFSDECTPSKALGACMVSSEASCNIIYKYDYSD